MIYLIKDEEGRFKIGYSKSIDGVGARLRALSTGNPLRLKISRIFDGTMEQEKKLHQMFAKYRVSGEWFSWPGKHDPWFYAARNHLEMDGPRLLNLDVSEIEHFVFVRGLNPSSVPVLDLQPCSTR